VAGHIFQARPVWIYTQSSITNIIFTWVHNTNTEKTVERLRYPGSGLRVRVSPFCLPIFADVSNFTRNFYPFPRGKPWSTRKRQTGTGVFCLLFLGRLNSTNFQHLPK
jgi:hypothetical protein